MKKRDFTSIPLANRPGGDVWQVLIEQSSQGQATLFQDEDGNYAVQFPDEDAPIPFGCLAYDRNLGLYDTRRFPRRQ